MNKAIIILLVIITVVVAAGYYLWRGTPATLPEPIVEVDDATYHSAQYGISFAYPQGYTLTERSDGFEGVTIQALTLLPTDVSIPEYSEGPPGMSVLIIPAATTTSLESWVRTKSISNFALSSEKTLKPLLVAGQPALSYRYSGLYENDAVAVLYNGRIYLFSGSWLAANDMIRRDFQSLLQSVLFVAP